MRTVGLIIKTANVNKPENKENTAQQTKTATKRKSNSPKNSAS